MKPDIDTALIERVRLCCNSAGGIGEMASKSGVARGSIENYLSGRSPPKLKPLVAIARAAGVSVEWLATGDGPMRPGEPPPAQIEAPSAPKPLDHDFGGDVVAAVMELYRSENVRLSNGRIASIALEKYEEIMSYTDTEEERQIALKAILLQLRKELRSGVSATAKGNTSA